MYKLFRSRLKEIASLAALVMPQVSEHEDCTSLDSNIMVLKESLDGLSCCCLVSYYFSQIIMLSF